MGSSRRGPSSLPGEAAFPEICRYNSLADGTLSSDV